MEINMSKKIVVIGADPTEPHYAATKCYTDHLIENLHNLTPTTDELEYVHYINLRNTTLHSLAGILEVTKNTNGLAAVMGHEIAHAVAKHSVERASRNVAINVVTQVTDILSGGKLSTVNRTTGMNTVGLLTQMGILNPFNRKQVSEADYLGLIFSSLSGYDIRETVKVWERMKKAHKGKTPPEFMSTHPSPDNRIKKINEWMNEVIIDYPPIKEA